MSFVDVAYQRSARVAALLLLRQRQPGLSRSVPRTLGEALAIRGEEAEASRSRVEDWLRRITNRRAAMRLR